MEEVWTHLGGDKMNNKRGCYRFEMFRCSKRRIGVMSDYHYGCGENGNTGDQSNVVDEIDRLRNRPEFLVMTGDLLHNPTKKDDRDIWSNFIDLLELKNIPVADGFGNHYLWTGFRSENVKNKIKNRNGMRRKEWNTFGYSDVENIKAEDNKGYHYRWKIELQKRMSNGELKQKTVECIMLNNVPGYVNVDDIGENGDKKVDKSQKEGTWCYDSLAFLDKYLSGLYKSSAREDIIVLLFFHINYESEVLENKAYYRWWPEDARKRYNDILKAYQFTNRAFFGHVHKGRMKCEELHLSKGNPTGLKGYSCATSIFERYLNVIDLELIEEGGKCKLQMTTSYGKTANLKCNGDGLKILETEVLA